MVRYRAGPEPEEANGRPKRIANLSLKPLNSSSELSCFFDYDFDSNGDKNHNNSNNDRRS